VNGWLVAQSSSHPQLLAQPELTWMMLVCSTHQSFLARLIVCVIYGGLGEQSGGVESSDEQGSCVLVKRKGCRREVQVKRLQEVIQEEKESTDMNRAARGRRGFMGVKLDDEQGAVRLHGRAGGVCTWVGTTVSSI